jgi:hypothetical protein
MDKLIAIEKLVRASTEKFNQDLVTPAEDSPWREPLAAFGCKKKLVQELVALLGFKDQVESLDLERQPNSVGLFHLSVVVPTSNPNSHSYGDNHPIVLVTNYGVGPRGVGITGDRVGHRGDGLPPGKKYYLPTTEEQILTALSYIKANWERLVREDEILKAVDFTLTTLNDL